MEFTNKCKNCMPVHTVGLTQPVRTQKDRLPLTTFTESQWIILHPSDKFHATKEGTARQATYVQILIFIWSISTVQIYYCPSLWAIMNWSRVDFFQFVHAYVFSFLRNRA
jgi:hypothetical protein